MLENQIFKKVIKSFWPPFILDKIFNVFHIRGNEYLEYPVIRGRIYIRNKGTLYFGRKNIFNCGRNNIIGGDEKFNIIVSENAKLKFGDNVGVSNSTFICRKSISIGNNVLIGGGCKFYDTDFHSLDFENRMSPYLNNIPDRTVKNRGINIEDGVWIGGHCIILKGVTIGERSVIGAGSVVSKNIPKNEVWAGNPAKFIKKIDYI
ncbi:acyltransferase [Echinicola arenosa]|nr:acyltransferase [Echinicola arenosa]